MKDRQQFVDLSEMCRLCFSEKSNLVPIFNNEDIPDLTSKIKDCVSIEILTNELPDQICSDCFHQVKNWIDFKQKCCTADGQLKCFLETSRVKEEETNAESDSSTAADAIYSDESAEEKPDVGYLLRGKRQRSQASVLVKSEHHTVTVKSERHTVTVKSERRNRRQSRYPLYRRKPYPCGLCELSFSRFCDLFNHDKQDHESIPRTHLCGTCGKLFVSEDRVRVHRARYHGEKPFACDMCGKRFLTKRTLQKHLVIHAKSYVCPYCGLCTSSGSSLREHERVHTGEKPYTCDECGNSYVSQQGLNSHMKTHSTEKQFMCDICGYAARNQSSVYIHKGSHSNVKPFICETCGKAFKSKIRLNEHHRRHTAEKRFTCETCQLSFRQNYQLVKHYRTHSGEKPFACDMCGKTFARNDSMKEHRRLHTGEKRYTCSVCMKAFSFLKTFKTHKCIAYTDGNLLPFLLEAVESLTTSQSFSPLPERRDSLSSNYEYVRRDSDPVNASGGDEQRSRDSSVENIKIDGTPDDSCDEEKNNRRQKARNRRRSRKGRATKMEYPCELCAQTFSKAFDLFKHDDLYHDDVPRTSGCKVCRKVFVSENRVRLHENRYHSIKLLQCTVCDKRFLSKVTLKGHMKAHSRTYTCDHCNLSTSTKAGLIEHVRTHTGERPFVCDECGTSFLSRASLNSHKKTHSDTRQYKCEVCGYAAKQRSVLFFHLTTHSDAKPYVCEVCGTSFKNQARLCDHRRRKHQLSKQFECDKCDMKFNQKYRLAAHYKVHDKQKLHMCNICQMEFITANSLKYHYRTHNGFKPFFCDKCDKSFTTNYCLYEHQRLHTGETPYTCQVCMTSFPFLKRFKRHKCHNMDGVPGTELPAIREIGLEKHGRRNNDINPSRQFENIPEAFQSYNLL